MEFLTDPHMWLALVTLTALEIVLGIDNIIFIAILAGRLPENQQAAGRRAGLGMALITRILLLFSLTLIMRLTAPLFTVLGNDISGRDIILLGGGLFLLAKSTVEIHAHIEGDEEDNGPGGKMDAHPSFFSVVSQIMVLDIVFSLDSVITAIGLAEQIGVMVAAIVIAVGFMMFLAGSVSAFIERHPTVKMLALSFLLLVGMALIGDGLDLHIPRGYIYFAMGFSIFVEMLNLKVRAREKSANR
ncbi:MAG: TerC family protein [Thermodesulfobacteriota bacterium]